MLPRGCTQSTRVRRWLQNMEKRMLVWTNYTPDNRVQAIFQAWTKWPKARWSALPLAHDTCRIETRESRPQNAHIDRVRVTKRVNTTYSLGLGWTIGYRLAVLVSQLIIIITTPGQRLNRLGLNHQSFVVAWSARVGLIIAVLPTGRRPELLL